MRINVNLQKEYGRPGSIQFEEHVSDAYPDYLKQLIALDLEALCNVFGGIALAVIEDMAIDKPYPRQDLIKDVMRTLEQFAARRVKGDAA